MNAGESITKGIAIIGATTAARQLLDAANTIRTDEVAGIEQLRDAIACAHEALEILICRQEPIMLL